MKRFASLCLLSAVAGYISLTQEMLWFRAVSYVTGGEPVVFAEVLGCFLVGAALGSLLGNWITRRGGDPMPLLGKALATAAVTYFLMIPLSAWALTVKGPGLAIIYLAVTLTALFAGTVLPVVCQIAITGEQDEGVGFSMSWIYAANIVGSTLGPILTGFVLLNHFRMVDLVLAVGLATLLLAIVVSWRERRWPVLYAAIGLAFVASHGMLYESLLERFHFKHEFARNGAYKYLLENRHGIIAVHSSEKRLEGHMTDVIYGGAIYDGTFNLDPLADSNLIVRAYMASTLHRNPARVLVIGLSSGSWARVVLDDPRVKQMDIVEINPGYLELIAKYPPQAQLLTDPRVRIFVDDGRRWLQRNPKERFDFILMNTSFHWRDGSTNLLSREFLTLCKERMNPGGVIYYNSTASKDVKWTAANVFGNATEYQNFVAGSDAPFDMSSAERLEHLRIDQGTLEGRSLLDRLAIYPFPDLKESLGREVSEKRLQVITDDNLMTEFKPRDRRWIDEDRSWSSLWRRLGPVVK